MNTQRTNKLYNFLVNTYGLSKEAIMGHIDIRINDLLDKHVKAKMDSSSIERIVANKVAYFMKTGKTDSWHSKHSFDDYMTSIIKDEVERQVKKNYKIDVTLK